MLIQQAGKKLLLVRSTHDYPPLVVGVAEDFLRRTAKILSRDDKVARLVNGSVWLVVPGEISPENRITLSTEFI